MTTAALRCLEHFASGVELMRSDDLDGLYRHIEQTLEELVGFRLLTLLRLDGSRLYRMHTSDLANYPVGGSKDIAHEPWLSGMLQTGVPAISAQVEHIRARFSDHPAIFALGCGSALNVPVVGPQGALGSINLLHQAGWFQPQHALLVLPFAALLALLWSSPAGPVPGTPTP